MCFICSACSGTKQASDNSAESSSQQENIEIDLEKSLQNYAGSDYHFDTDYQSYFDRPCITKGEKGYYYWLDNRIYYYDTATEQNVALCSKAECKHSDETCNAYFNEDFSGDKDSFVNSYVQYYDGSLYVVGVDPKGKVNLYKVAADGSSRDRYMTLFKQNINSVSGDQMIADFTYPDICIHRGYVYYINNMESEPKLYRAKLGSDRSEVIYENEGTHSTTYRIKPYGDRVYFQSGNFTDEDQVNVEGGIYAYDIEKQKVSLYKESAISDYLFYEDTLYYSTAEGICRAAEEKGSDDDRIIETKSSHADFFLLNEQTIAYMDDRDMVVCDFKDKKEHVIRDDRMDVCYFGDGSIFFAGGAEDSASVLLLIRADEIGTADKWTNAMNVEE